MITESIKDPIRMYLDRTLYRIEETYQDNSKYFGYYVENRSKNKGQAYRYKTVSNGVTVIEDKKALNKAQDTLINGFKF